MLGLEPRTLGMLSMYFTTQLHSSPQYFLQWSKGPWRHISIIYGPGSVTQKDWSSVHKSSHKHKFQDPSQGHGGGPVSNMHIRRVYMYTHKTHTQTHTLHTTHLSSLCVLGSRAYISNLSSWWLRQEHQDF